MAFELQNWLAGGDPYRILGIVLPVLMIGMAAGAIFVNSATHLSNVRRTSARLESWLKLSDTATEKLAAARAISARGAGAAFKRFLARLWLVVRVRLTRRRYLDDVETIRRRNRKAFIDERLVLLESRETGERREIGSVVAGLRDEIRVLRNRGVGQALAVGVATSVMAFAIATTQAPAAAAGFAAYGTAAAALALFLLLAIVYVLGGILLRWCRADRRTPIGAFAWVSSIPLYVYNSRTVGPAVICMATMLVVREVLYHRYRTIATAADEGLAKEHRIVGETLWFASDGGRLEAWLRIRIGVCYMLVVIHLLVPPIRDLGLCETMCGDLLAVAAVAAVTLMVPLAAMFMDGRTRIRATT